MTNSVEHAITVLDFIKEHGINRGDYKLNRVSGRTISYIAGNIEVFCNTSKAEQPYEVGENYGLLEIPTPHRFLVVKGMRVEDDKTISLDTITWSLVVTELKREAENETSI